MPRKAIPYMITWIGTDTGTKNRLSLSLSVYAHSWKAASTHVTGYAPHLS